MNRGTNSHGSFFYSKISKIIFKEVLDFLFECFSTKIASI